MTTDLQLFTFGHAEVRVLQIDGEPWFIARDVCNVLEIQDSSMAVGGLDEDEKQQVSSNTISTGVAAGGRDPWVISESGLYSMILRSRKPEARTFKRWVTGEVLPQIRRTGSYAPQKELSRLEFARMLVEAEEARERAEEITRQRELDLKVTEAKNLALEARKREDAPKVSAYEALMEADGAVSMNSAAKILDWKPMAFWAVLREYRIIIPGKTVPYQKYIDQGWFKVRAGMWGKPTTDGNELTEVTRVTAKGLDRIRDLLRAPAPE
jgi:prophage antirepressor-like protein